MTQKFKRKKIFTALVLATGIMWSGVSSAALINGDFSAGFNGWQGAVVDQGNNYSQSTAPSTTFSSNFSISGGNALLTADAGNNWSVELFQDFQINSITAGNNLSLSLGLTSVLTSVSDFVYAQLIVGSDTLDITAGGIFDVTAWQGQIATLSFLIEDDDFSAFDTLEISDISFTENQATVPEPGTLLLIGAGLMAMRRKFFNTIGLAFRN